MLWHEMSKPIFWEKYQFVICWIGSEPEKFKKVKIYVTQIVS